MLVVTNIMPKGNTNFSLEGVIENDAADLSNTDKEVLDDFNSGSLMRIRDECDAAFGWNNQMRDAAGSAAAQVGR